MEIAISFVKTHAESKPGIDLSVRKPAFTAPADAKTAGSENNVFSLGFESDAWRGLMGHHCNHMVAFAAREPDTRALLVVSRKLLSIRALAGVVGRKSFRQLVLEIPTDSTTGDLDWCLAKVTTSIGTNWNPFRSLCKYTQKVARCVDRCASKTTEVFMQKNPAVFLQLTKEEFLKLPARLRAASMQNDAAAVANLGVRFYSKSASTLVYDGRAVRSSKAGLANLQTQLVASLTPQTCQRLVIAAIERALSVDTSPNASALEPGQVYKMLVDFIVEAVRLVGRERVENDAGAVHSNQSVSTRSEVEGTTNEIGSSSKQLGGRKQPDGSIRQLGARRKQQGASSKQLGAGTKQLGASSKQTADNIILSMLHTQGLGLWSPATAGNATQLDERQENILATHVAVILAVRQKLWEQKLKKKAWHAEQVALLLRALLCTPLVLLGLHAAPTANTVPTATAAPAVCITVGKLFSLKSAGRLSLLRASQNANNGCSLLTGSKLTSANGCQGANNNTSLPNNDSSLMTSNKLTSARECQSRSPGANSIAPAIGSPELMPTVGKELLLEQFSGYTCRATSLLESLDHELVVQAWLCGGKGAPADVVLKALKGWCDNQQSCNKDVAARFFGQAEVVLKLCLSKGSNQERSSAVAAPHATDSSATSSITSSTT